jgi:hypothetical protein
MIERVGLGWMEFVESFGEPMTGASSQSGRRLVVLAVVFQRWQVGANPLQFVAKAVVGCERLFYLGRFGVIEGVEQETDEVVTRWFNHKVIGRCRAVLG